MHQPLGLMLPCTILHVPLADEAFPGMNCMQPSHSCEPCGFSWYFAIALDSVPLCAGAFVFNISPPGAEPVRPAFRI